MTDIQQRAATKELAEDWKGKNYGFWSKLNTESDCVAALMEMYAEMTKEK